MCGVKLVDKRNTEELTNMLGLKEAADKQARGSGMRWYGHVLRRPEEDVLMKVMVHEVEADRRPKMKWREQVEENIRISLRKDAADRCRWRGERRIAEVMG